MTPRPQGALDVVGASRALAYFGMLEPASLSHGYLFSGQAGVGKKTFARRLAQSLFCRQPKTALLGYDGSCAACTSFLAGSYPDYYESEGRIVIGSAQEAADTGRDGERSESVRERERMESRALVRELQLRPYSGQWRVVVLGDIEFASTEAAHALLRFLEEPPPDVLIVLTTEAPGTLLDTIRSRLIEIPFPPLARDEVERILERDGIDRSRARFAASAAMGSITRARAILDGQETGLREAALTWFEDAISGRTPDSSFLDRASKAADKRRIAGDVLEFVRVFARDWAALQFLGRDAPLLAADLKVRIQRLPKRSRAEAAEILAQIAETQRLANTNVTPSLVLDFLRMRIT
ncbi:MAG: hypothetical protein JO043_02850 [Candidatus Eremiobacteraeota bacterium]|nr:hypothetical protein [Candidatus Eremiobacteraeota bacterium]